MRKPKYPIKPGHGRGRQPISTEKWPCHMLDGVKKTFSLSLLTSDGDLIICESDVCEMSRHCTCTYWRWSSVQHRGPLSQHIPFFVFLLGMCYIVYRLSTFLAIIFQCVWTQIYEFAIHKLSWTNYILFVYLVLQTSKTSSTEVLPKTLLLFVLTLWPMCRETAKKVQEAWQS